jgi:hypothetical protein
VSRLDTAEGRPTHFVSQPLNHPKCTGSPQRWEAYSPHYMRGFNNASRMAHATRAQPQHSTRVSVPIHDIQVLSDLNALEFGLARAPKKGWRSASARPLTPQQFCGEQKKPHEKRRRHTHRPKPDNNAPRSTVWSVFKPGTGNTSWSSPRCSSEQPSASTSAPGAVPGH